MSDKDVKAKAAVDWAVDRQARDAALWALWRGYNCQSPVLGEGRRDIWAEVDFAVAMHEGAPARDAAAFAAARVAIG